MKQSLHTQYIWFVFYLNIWNSAKRSVQGDLIEDKVVGHSWLGLERNRNGRSRLAITVTLASNCVIELAARESTTQSRRRRWIFSEQAAEPTE